MENPFNDKESRQESSDYPNGLTNSHNEDQGNQNNESTDMVHPMAQTGSNIITMSQESRVVLPTIMSNHDQGPTQDGMENEIGTEMGALYPSIDASLQPVYGIYAGRMNNENSTVDDMDMGDGKQRLENTLVGRIISYMKRVNQPVSISEIIADIGLSFGTLQKADGSHYKGNKDKAVSGALYSAGVFQKINDKWTLRTSRIDEYERKKQSKLSSVGKRKRNTKRNQPDENEEKPAKRKYTKRQVKKETMVRMLHNVTEHYRMNPTDENSRFFKNPFQGLNGGEPFIRIRKKLGDEKFEMAVQMFVYFEDLFAPLLSEDAAKNENSATSERTNAFINRLQQEVYEMKNRMTQLEKMHGTHRDITL